MSNNAGPIDQAAAEQNATNASQALQNYQGAESGYLSNVNSLLAQGSPYQTQAYKTNQNLETSGAMNSANTAEQQMLGSTVARTGTNSAALANTEAASARAGQRDLTQYNAARDTSNVDKWQEQQDRLLQDQQAGANSEAGVYGTSTSGQSSDLSSMTTADDAYNQMWAGLGSAAVGAVAPIAKAF